MEISGRVAIVTGAAVRLGRAISLALAANGCDLLLHYGRSEEQAREVSKEAAGFGVRVALHRADLRDPEAARSIVREARQRLGRADILINSAALFEEGDLASTTVESWERQFAVNLRAPYLLCQEFAAAVAEGEKGRIVNILDARIFRPGSDHFAYRLTKTALRAMTESLALDLAPRITVNAVAPGAILAPPGEGVAYLQKLAKDRIPLAASGDPGEVAEAVLHMLRSDFMTGVTLRLDGGEFL